MDYSSILRYFEKEVSLESLAISDFQAIILIGSFAYPEFARHNSDIDLIGVCQSRKVRPITKIIKRPGENMLELRIMNIDDFRSYLLNCDLPKLFAFIRGYSFLLERKHSDVKSFVETGINRYKTDSFRLASQLKEQNLEIEKLGARLQLTDAFSYICNSRRKDNYLLLHLRIGEILKDFIIHYWKLILIQELQEINRIDFETHKSTLLDIGLFRVFAESRGARIMDYEKYNIRHELVKVIQKLVKLFDIYEIKKQLQVIFTDRFSQPLFIDQNENVETRWAIV